MPTRPVSRALVLALSLCVVLATTPGLRILCVGSDGHVSIEMAFDDCCDHPEAPPPAELASSCEGCEDEMLELPGVIAKDSASLDELVAGAWVAAPRASEPAAAPRWGRLDPGLDTPGPQGESSSRSVVLRC